MTIPNGITRQHILDAMTGLGPDQSTWPPQSQSTVYDINRSQKRRSVPSEVSHGRGREASDRGEPAAFNILWREGNE
jgi:hypothetical protein